ncbi:hypermethylated in cancer 2 protein-like [Carassius carassius]|uniref:hypermethylated in cancer 2 protein-like n=1 Tax=Carassius carassius TaxID=217509 RepID=UPI00286846E4|nr:hypermethylated in cancer 2 protein-like [Carassius carassius]
MELPNHAKQLLLQLNQQRAKGYLCDVIIVVENALFRAHKNILAASSIYFKSLILHDNLINLDTDMVNPSVFRQVLDFIYTGKLLSSDQFSGHNFSALLTAASYLQLHDLAALCRKKLKRNGRSLLNKPATPTNGRTSRNQRLSSTPVTPNQMSGLKDSEKTNRHEELLKEDLSDDEMFVKNTHCTTSANSLSPSMSKNGSNGSCGMQELGLDLSKKSPSGSTATEEVSPSSIPQESPQSASESTANSASFDENTNTQNLTAGEPMELGRGECEKIQPPLDVEKRKSSRQVARQRRQPKSEGNKREDAKRGILPNSVVKRLKVVGERLPGGGNGNSEVSFQWKDDEEGLENGQEQSEESGQSECEGGQNSTNYVFRQEGFEPALGDNLYVCIPCGKGFPSSEELNAHVETHTEEELYIKEEEDDSYPKEDEVEAEDLSSQVTHVLGTESRRFSCSVCNKSYKDPATLRQHEKTHWLTRPFPCNICGKMFTQRGTMTRHMRSHLGLKPFACDECGMRFTRQYRLTEHMRVHSGEKPYECQLCGGKFTQQRNLISHLRMHTSPS